MKCLTTFPSPLPRTRPLRVRPGLATYLAHAPGVKRRHDPMASALGPRRFPFSLPLRPLGFDSLSKLAEHHIGREPVLWFWLRDTELRGHRRDPAQLLLGRLAGATGMLLLYVCTRSKNLGCPEFRVICCPEFRVISNFSCPEFRGSSDLLWRQEESG